MTSPDRRRRFLRATDEAVRPEGSGPREAGDGLAVAVSHRWADDRAQLVIAAYENGLVRPQGA